MSLVPLNHAVCQQQFRHLFEYRRCLERSQNRLTHEFTIISLANILVESFFSFVFNVTRVSNTSSYTKDLVFCELLQHLRTYIQIYVLLPICAHLKFPFNPSCTQHTPRQRRDTIRRHSNSAPINSKHPEGPGLGATRPNTRQGNKPWNVYGYMRQLRELAKDTRTFQLPLNTANRS